MRSVAFASNLKIPRESSVWNVRPPKIEVGINIIAIKQRHMIILLVLIMACSCPLIESVASSQSQNRFFVSIEREAPG